MANNVTVNDLQFAVEWLRGYEGVTGETVQQNDNQDEETRSVEAVARWIEAEIRRREQVNAENAVMRRIAEQGRKITRQEARQALVNARKCV